MKKCIPLILLCLLLAACGQPDYNGSRLGNDRELHMTYTAFNTTDGQTLSLEAGETLQIQVVSDAGCLSMTIQKEGDDPIYQGTNLPTQTFTVAAEEAGDYTVTLTGETAKGSVDITIGSNTGAGGCCG